MVESPAEQDVAAGRCERRRCDSSGGASTGRKKTFSTEIAVAAHAARVLRLNERKDHLTEVAARTAEVAARTAERARALPSHFSASNYRLGPRHEAP